MDLIVRRGGAITCLYGETINLAAIGGLTIRRASHVEPDESGHWFADLAPLFGPKLGPFALRSDALVAEETWLSAQLAAVASDSSSFS